MSLIRELGCGAGRNVAGSAFDRRGGPDADTIAGCEVAADMAIARGDHDLYERANARRLELIRAENLKRNGWTDTAPAPRASGAPKSALLLRLEALTRRCDALASVIDRRKIAAVLAGRAAPRCARPAPRCGFCGDSLDSFGDCFFCD
jgi:hypothetical protein